MPCTDDNPCTDELCDPTAGCSHIGNAAPCSDNNACTQGDICSNSTCAGSAIACDDGNPCSDDACDPITGCTAKANQGACEDGDPCTLGDSCSAGLCQGGPANPCDDKNACTDDSCIAATGCQHLGAGDGKACDDGNACSVGDACAGGACKGQAIDCNDKNPCTDDKCDSSLGCQHSANAAACDDGNPCSSGDVCKGGICKGIGKFCSDDNPCTDDACLDNSCIFSANTASCDDSNPCTQGDACSKGLCAAGKAVSCDDKNPCTTDSCNPGSGSCVFAANAEPCDDGSACTTGDTCGGGGCSGNSKVCNDGKPCTIDSCNPTTGTCVSSQIADGNPCDDGSVCSQKDTCTGGECVGQKIVCDDGNACTIDSCDGKSGCQAVPGPGGCSDGNACTSGDTCQGGACVPGGASSCDDDNPCTTDSCTPIAGCSHSSSGGNCNDDNACTSGDACKNGACLGTAVVCNDSNLCTNDSCDTQAGCQFVNNAALCSDGNVCTTDDVCQGGKCLGLLVIDCNDFNPCTTDVCDPKLACQHKAIADGSKCDDGNGCTVQDACVAGKCLGQGKSCDDANPCTADGCVANVCTNTPAKGPCNDNNPCTLIDNCDLSGACQGSSPQSCDDGNPCTDDSCNPASGGCTHKANAIACNDGNFCTVGEFCSQGQCQGGAAATCDDGNACTGDTCDPVGAKCSHVNNIAKCNDGNACTVGDTCATGKCVAGKATLCDDNNPCTTDSCDTNAGNCVFAIAQGQSACPVFSIPFTSPIDYADALWSGSSKSSTVKWQADATPNPGGALTGLASLNFNNSKDYNDPSLPSVSGQAVGKFWIDATALPAPPLTLAFYSYADVEIQADYDKRLVEFSTDGFATIALAFQLDNSVGSKQWRLEALPIGTLAGKKFQMRFRFDSVDNLSNSGAGWFVDEVNLYAGPVVMIAAGASLDEPFSGNSNGWQFQGPVGSQSLWAIDNSPNPPGAVQGNSLNFNNGKNYDNGAVSGLALSPVINLTQVKPGAPITLLWKEWVDVEVDASHDLRYVEVTADAFASTLVPAQQVNLSSVMKGWRWNWLDLSSAAGKVVRLRFRFDSVDGLFNTGAGWFIDDLQLQVQAAPTFADMITCANAASWTVAKTGLAGPATWGVDATGIAAKSPDCSLNFNASNALGGSDFSCTGGSGASGHVAGTITGAPIQLPVLSGLSKLWLQFAAYVDTETLASVDVLTVQVKDISGKLPPVQLAIDKNAALKTWKDQQLDVSALAGKSVVVVFAFDSVDCIANSGAGVAIDDVMLRIGP